MICSFRNVFLGDFDLINLDPAWMRYPLRCKALDVFDCVVGRVEEKFTNEMKTFVIGNMRCRLLCKRFAI